MSSANIGPCRPALFQHLHRWSLHAAATFSAAMCLGAIGLDIAKAASTTRTVQFPRISIGRLYAIRPGYDFIQHQSLNGKFLGAAVNAVTVPVDARLSLELDPNLAENPHALDGMDKHALTAIHLRYAEGNGGITTSISELTSLIRVELADCEFNDSAIAKLKNLKSLERLAVVTCGINGSCFHELKTLPLRYLNASLNKFRPETFQDLSQMSTMEYLDLGHVGMTDQGLIALSHLHKLKSLNLNSNSGITPRGLASLKACHELHDLYLRGGSIKAHDVFVLKGLPLQTVGLTEKSLPEDELTSLKKTFPGCNFAMTSKGVNEDDKVIFAPITR